MKDLSSLTKNQKDILHIIAAYLKDKGYPPTIREILERSDLKSLRGVVLQLEVLEKLGAINRDSSARAISINKSFSFKKKIKVPLMSSSVSAGFMQWVNAEDSNNFSNFLEVGLVKCNGYKNLYAAKVKGDSMIGVGIYEDDYVLFTCQDSAKDGDIVLANHNDEMTIKKFRIVEDRPILFPANKKYPPLLEEFTIQGKVISIVSKSEAKVISI